VAVPANDDDPHGVIGLQLAECLQERPNEPGRKTIAAILIIHPDYSDTVALAADMDDVSH
jgi:hypothetical protein